MRRGHRRTRRASLREPWRRERATATRAQRPPLLKPKTPRLVSHQRDPAGQEQPTESTTRLSVNCKVDICWPLIQSSDYRYCSVHHHILSMHTKSLQMGLVFNHPEVKMRFQLSLNTEAHRQELNTHKKNLHLTPTKQ